ncbi:MAG TPA: hypothetical protein VFZ04_06830 [Longimicrobiales bacterium]
MTNLHCEYVREVYPDVLHGRAAASTVSAVRAHIAGCADCRAEAELIEQLQRTSLQVPAGLHERVVAGLRRPARGRRFELRHLAFAATLAAALIGGSLLLDSMRAPVSRAATQAPGAGGLGVITVEAAMVTGTGSLQDLTVEELELLLGEIES